MTWVVLSDLHLGTVESNKEHFRAFLAELGDEVQRLILLGDIFDLWRRDPLGVLLENVDVLQQLLNLQPRVRVSFVVGNHDYHLFTFIASYFGTTFELTRDLRLEHGATTYRFIHGYQLENKRFGTLELYELFADRMCRAGEDVGRAADAIWEAICAERDIWNKLILNSWVKEKTKEINLPPEDRNLEKLDQYAIDLVKKDVRYRGSFLIFGHTHAPFVKEEEHVANTGSWVKPSATYLVITDRGVRLEEYG